MQVNRDRYLEALIDQEKSPLITVVTGLRRCGKSYLLYTLYRDHLLASGVSADQIIMVDLDDFANKTLRDSATCYQFVKQQIKDDRQYYLLIDEVQNLDTFADVLNGLNKLSNLHIYATGSNSHLLSTDVATEFRGRSDVVHIRPFSFAEFATISQGDFYDEWAIYYTYGGLPLVALSGDDETKIRILNSLIESIYLRDISERYALRGEGRMMELLRVLASTIGSPVSSRKLTDTFNSRGNDKISRNTIIRYLQIMEESFLVDRAPVWDIKGKKYIDAPEKYYFTDPGLRNALLGFGSLGQIEPTHLMENVIYNELKIRGYQIKVGSVEDRNNSTKVMREVDFVIEKAGELSYVQSAWSMPDSVKLQQELKPLLAIPDTRRKIVITADPIHSYTTPEGIQVVSLRDFLFDTEMLLH